MKHNVNTKTDRRGFINAAAIGTTATLSTGALASDAQEERSLKEVRRYSIAADSPRRIATDSKDSWWILAGDSIEHRDQDGALRLRVSLERPGRALAVTDTGVFVAVRNQIAEFSRTGELQRRFARIPEGLIGDIVVDGDRLIVTDLASGRLMRTSRIGWEAFGDPIRQSARISHGVTGDLLIADPERHQVKLISLDGSEQRVWGKRSRDSHGFQGCCNPMALAETVNGGVATVEAGQVRIKTFSKDGDFLSEVAGPSTISEIATTPTEDRSLACAAGGVDVATNSSGELYFLHCAAKQVIYFA
ncbi:MAG: hypothetical protein AAFX06_32290 [Planctomycetota bacterium]